MSAVPPPTPAPPLPAGVFTVEPDESQVGFAVKGMWGLVTVRGAFREYAGTLEVSDGGVQGELIVETASLDTKQAKRDLHLRSADFFDVGRHPRLRFVTSAVTSQAGTLTAIGDLIVGASQVKLRIPIELEQLNDGALLLRGECNVSPTAVGLGWNKLGAIRGEAKLHVELLLRLNGV